MSSRKLPIKTSRLQNQVKFTQKECEECPQTDKLLQVKYNKTEKIKKQNDKLRSELREMSKQLDETLDRIKQKKNTEKISEMDQQKKIEILQNELKNTEKQLKTYKHQHSKLEEKIAGSYDVDKITGMLRVVKNREYELYELKEENKNLISLKRESDRILAKKNNDKILNTLRDEVMMTKSLIAEAKRKERINEKGFKKQQEYIAKLELKHREICEQLGVEFEVIAPRREELFPITEGKQKPKLNQSILSQRSSSTQLPRHHNRSSSNQSNQRQKRVRQKLYESIDDQEDRLPEDEWDITQEKFEQFDKQIDIIKKSMKQNKELHQKQMKLKEEKIVNIQKQGIAVELEVKEKSQELEKLLERIKQMQEQLQKHPEQNLDNNSQYLAKVKDKQIMKKGKPFKKIIGGVKQHSDQAQQFMDAKHLPELKDYKIYAIRATFGDEYILSMEVDYFLRDGSIKNITCFKNSVQVKNQQQVQLTLKGVEYVQQVMGIYNDQHIEYLKIVSSRGNYLMAGTDKLNTPNSQKFNLNINKDEKPISFFGTVDKLPKIKKNKNRGSEYCLVSIGVECRKKDVYIAASNVLTEKLNREKLEKKQKLEQKQKQKEEQQKQSAEKQQEEQFEEDLGERDDDNDKIIANK